MVQYLFDGILFGSIVALGAIGMTMIMHMLRFANFAHAELLSIGAYAALVFDRLFAVILPALSTSMGPFSVTASLLTALIVSGGVTGLSAALLDRLVFQRVRDKAGALSAVFASFGAALVIRNVLGLVFGLRPHLYNNDIVFAVQLSTNPSVLVKPDQIIVLILALLIMLVFHLILSRTTFGYALRAVAENPSLAQLNGIRLSKMIVLVWIIGGSLAAASGVFYGLDNQVSPLIGRNLLLPLFAATIVGGIGSIYGALAGGFIVGLATSFALLILPSGYGPAVPFLIIMAVLMVKPNGLFAEQHA